MTFIPLSEIEISTGFYSPSQITTDMPFEICTPIMVSIIFALSAAFEVSIFTGLITRISTATEIILTTGPHVTN
jgi:hypothetical protein